MNKPTQVAILFSASITILITGLYTENVPCEVIGLVCFCASFIETLLEKCK